MIQKTTADVYLKARYSLFRWCYSLTFVDKIFLALGMACVSGLAAQIRIYLPWTPVPVTAQTFVVLMAGVLLRRWWGGVSQAIYVAMGAIGTPWFAGWNGGYSVLVGPTGGYMVGFILAALFIGHMTDRCVKTSGFLPMFGLMLFANFGLIHIPGLLQLGLWSYLIKGVALSPWELLLMGTVPFVIGDIAKIVGATAVAKAITPENSCNDEVNIIS